MSVLIRGMEMPENCYVCPFMFHQRGVPEVWCTAIENHWLDLRKVLSCDRHDDCPITTVPAHGRLIDADALYSHIKDEQRKCNDPYDGWSECQVALWFINTAPTIIPAEEGQE